MKPDTTIGEVLRRSARDHADRHYIHADDRRLSFADVDLRVDRLASGLMRAGVGHGDHIAVWLTNTPEWVLVLLAAARIGAAVVPVNTRYKKDEAEYILAQSDAKVLVMTPTMWGIDFVRLLVEAAPSIERQTAGDLSLPELPALKTVIMVGDPVPAWATPFDALAATEIDATAIAAAEARVRAGDLLLICYTSGTTGRPKGAMHDHRVIHQSIRVGDALRMRAGSQVMAHLPYYHVAGMFMCLLPALAAGATMHLMAQWEAGRALDLIERERLTIFGGLPTHFLDMMGTPGFAERDLSALEGTWMGGSTVPEDVFLRIVRAYGFERLLSTYGMTENTISTTFNRWDDSLDDCRRNTAPILSDCEVRIVDPETGEVLGPDRDGEIQCRGTTVMMGYYKNPQETAATIDAEGWLKTGDIGRFDRRGYLGLTGRIKEMFKVGGTNAYPSEIEQHLATHPAIQISVVVGAPDARLGEVGMAFVLPRPGVGLTEADVITHCRGRIADFKVPRHVRLVSELPLTTTGKVQRAELIRQAREHVAALEPAKG
ncbi:AMP-binding protein [Pinisolibacter aquiterrae]|uniref:AMP-binding protein n=1 Tax=Pinisolibacter aquiterrae TaxID=2815579 RepID=UPI001C3DC609|nr:AMP-binding protein [Pinisolibacter aquiterrae]MBV5266881.1 AMP-binding protein [Pinisolibacter aquiterrae]MCC8234808.1 AMP-binding protein [Pinisolibacter aquiterrae]